MNDTLSLYPPLCGNHGNGLVSVAVAAGWVPAASVPLSNKSLTGRKKQSAALIETRGWKTSERTHTKKENQNQDQSKNPSEGRRMKKYRAEEPEDWTNDEHRPRKPLKYSPKSLKTSEKDVKNNRNIRRDSTFLCSNKSKDGTSSQNFDSAGRKTELTTLKITENTFSQLEPCRDKKRTEN